MAFDDADGPPPGDPGDPCLPNQTQIDGNTAFHCKDDTFLRNKEPTSVIGEETVVFNHDNLMDADSAPNDAAFTENADAESDDKAEFSNADPMDDNADDVSANDNQGDPSSNPSMKLAANADHYPPVDVPKHQAISRKIRGENEFSNADPMDDDVDNVGANDNQQTGRDQHTNEMDVASRGEIAEFHKDADFSIADDNISPMAANTIATTMSPALPIRKIVTQSAEKQLFSTPIPTILPLTPMTMPMRMR